MSYLKSLNSFLPISIISLCKYKGFIPLLGREFIFVKITCSPARYVLSALRCERITQKRVARLAPGFVRERHIWCESVHKFWSYRPKCDVIWLIHIIWIWKRIILTSVAISVLIDSIDHTWHHVAECSHLATNLTTDTHTHTHTHTQTNFFPQVKNIIPFFSKV